MNKVLFKNCRYLICKAAPEKGILEDGAVYVEGPVIKAVGPTAEIERLVTDENTEVLDCRNKIVMPGLIDSHNHVGEYHQFLILGMSSWKPVRGIIDVLHHYIWPAWTWLTEESTYDLTLLGIVNLLKHGTTTTANAFHFPDAVYKAAELSRMRMVIQPQMVTAYEMSDGLDEQGYLAQTEDAIRNYHNTLDGRITVDVHTSWPWNCTESMLVKGMALAEKYDVQFATHLFEAPDEKRLANELCANEGGAIQYLRNIGLVNERSVFFHCTQLNEEEIDIMAEAGCAITHCPTNNARKGDCAYLPYMRDAGVRLGLATDNPTGNLFKDMAAMSLFHNIMPREKRSVPVWAPLELATTGSAKVLRMDDRVGTLEPDKRADIITIDLRRNTDLMPLNAGMLFYFLCINGPGAVAADVMVDGVFLRREGEFTMLDEEAIIAKATQWFEKFTDYYVKGQEERRSLIKLVHNEFTRQ